MSQVVSSDSNEEWRPADGNSGYRIAVGVSLAPTFDGDALEQRAKQAIARKFGVAASVRWINAELAGWNRDRRAPAGITLGSFVESMAAGGLDGDASSEFEIVLAVSPSAEQFVVFRSHSGLCDRWSLFEAVAGLARGLEARESPAAELVDGEPWAVASPENLRAWSRYLGGCAAPRIGARTSRVGRGGSVAVPIDEPVSLALNEVAVAHDCSRGMVFLAAYAIVLKRYSDVSEMIIANPRPVLGSQQAGGPSSNVVPIRLSLKAARSVGDFLRYVRAQVLAADELPKLYFPHLALGAEAKDAACCGFVLWQPDAYGSWPRKLFRRSAARAQGAEGFELLLVLEELRDGTVARLSHDGVIHPGIGEAMAQDYVQILREIADDATASIHPLGRTRRTGGNTASTAEGASIIRGVDAALARTPDRLVLCSGDRALTSRDLLGAVSGMASRMRGCNVGAKPLIACVYGDELDLAVTALAAWSLGGSVLPLRLEASNRGEGVRNALDALRPAIVLSREKDMELLGHSSGHVLCFESCGSLPADSLVQRVGPEDVAVVYPHSSLPGGAYVVSHAQLFASVSWVGERLGAAKATSQILIVGEVGFWEVLLGLWAGVPTTIVTELPERVQEGALLWGQDSIWRLLDTDQRAEVSKGVTYVSRDGWSRETIRRMLAAGAVCWSVRGGGQYRPWLFCQHEVQSREGYLGIPANHVGLHVVDGDGCEVPRGARGELAVEAQLMETPYVRPPALGATSGVFVTHVHALLMHIGVYAVEQPDGVFRLVERT